MELFGEWHSISKNFCSLIEKTYNDHLRGSKLRFFSRCWNETNIVQKNCPQFDLTAVAWQWVHLAERPYKSEMRLPKKMNKYFSHQTYTIYWSIAYFSENNFFEVCSFHSISCCFDGEAVYCKYERSKDYYNSVRFLFCHSIVHKKASFYCLFSVQLLLGFFVKVWYIYCLFSLALDWYKLLMLTAASSFGTFTSFEIAWIVLDVIVSNWPVLWNLGFLLVSSSLRNEELLAPACTIPFGWSLRPVSLRIIGVKSQNDLV